MKRQLSILLVICMLFTCITPAVMAADAKASGTCGDNITWVLDNDGVLTISGTGAMADYATTSEIPWYSYKADITKIVVEDGVTHIGSRAFRDTAAVEAVFAPSVTSISNSAFNTAYNLKSVDLGGNVSTIGNYAFYNCDKLTGIDLKGVNTLGSYVFNGSGALASVAFYEEISSIGASTFAGCTKLSDVYYSGTQEQWGNVSIASGNTQLTSLSLRFTKSGSVNDSVNWEYYGLGKLRITGTGAMSDYSNVSETPWYSYISNIREVIIDDGITHVGNRSFRGATALTKISLASSVSSIGATVFYGCSAIASVELPKTVKSLGQFAFYNCDALTEVSLCGVKTIGVSAFGTCDKLNKITLSSDIMSIAENAFYSCGKLTDVYYLGTQKQWESVSVSSSGNTSLTGATFYFVQTDEDVVASGSCGDNLEWVLKKDGILTIFGTGAMWDYSSASEIPWYAFKASITGINMEEGITYIGARAFRDLSITSIIIPEGVTEIATSAFNSCSKLETVVFPDTLKTVTGYAFYNCDALKAIELPNIVTIGSPSFGSCDVLKTVSFGKTIKTISANAFSGSNAITDVYYAGTAQEWAGVSIASGNDPIKNANLHTEEAEVITITQPDNLRYKYGESIDLTGVVIESSKAGLILEVTGDYTVDGYNPYVTGAQDITISSAGLSATVTIEGLNPFAAGTQTVKVSYMGVSIEFAVEIVKLTSIEVSSLPYKLTYELGEELDISGMEVKAIYSDGTAEVLEDGYTVSGFDASVAGVQTLTVTYERATTTFDVTVNETPIVNDYLDYVPGEMPENLITRPTGWCYGAINSSMVSCGWVTAMVEAAFTANSIVSLPEGDYWGVCGLKLAVNNTEWAANTNYVYATNIKTVVGNPKFNFVFGSGSGRNNIFPDQYGYEGYTPGTEYEKYAITFNSGSKTSASIFVGLSSAPTGDVIYQDFSKESYLGEEVAYDITNEITEDSSVITIGKSVSLKAQVVNQVGIPGHLSQNFIWKAMNTDRTEEIEGIIVEVCEDGTAIVTVGEEVAPGDYDIVAYSEDYGMAKGVTITVEEAPVIVVHTVVFNGREYYIEDGRTLGDNEELRVAMESLVPPAGYEHFFEAEGDFVDGMHTMVVTVDTVVTSDMIVNYMCTPIQYTITYYSNGTEIMPDDAWYEYTVEDTPFALPVLSTDFGYIFGGWYDNPEFNGDPIAQIDLGTTGDLTFYAKWILAENAVLGFNTVNVDPAARTITLDVTLSGLPYDIADLGAVTLNYTHTPSVLTYVGATTELGGELSHSDGMIAWYNVDGVSADELAAREGKLFTITYSYEPSYCGEIVFDYADTELASLDFDIAIGYTIDSTVIWVERSVHYVTFDGVAYEVEHGAPLNSNYELWHAMSNIPCCEGYVPKFIVTTVSGEVTENLHGTVYEDATITVEYIPTAYSLNFIVNGAEYDWKSYTVESEFLLPEYFDDEVGVFFSGWYTNPECTGEPIYRLEKGTIGNHNLYAKWYAGIEMESDPIKTNYLYGEVLDLTGMVVNSIWYDGTAHEVTDYEVTGYDAYALGEQTITVYYEGFEATFTVVVDPVVEPGIIISQLPYATQYGHGEELDLTGLVVNAIYADGTSEEIFDYEVYGYDSQMVGEQIITVTYNGYEVTFTVNVVAMFDGIEIASLPYRTEYEYGEELDLAGLIVNAIFSDGTMVGLENYEFEVSGYDAYTVGEQIITVSYIGCEATFTVNVMPQPVVLCGIEITSLPYRTEYEYGEELDLTGLVVTAFYSYGAYEDITTYEISGYDAYTSGEQTITVYYEGYEATFTVTVAEEPVPPVPTGAAITVSKAKVLAGNTVSVDVAVDNNPGVASMVLKLHYDSEYMTITEVNDGGILGATLHSDDLALNPYILTWANDTAEENITANGVIATLTFTLAEDAPVDTYPVWVSYDNSAYDIFDVNLDPVEFATVDGEIRVVDYILGDVNDDGSINALDRAVLARYLSKWIGYEQINTMAADVNCDGRVNTLDRAILARYISGWTGYETLPYEG